MTSNDLEPGTLVKWFSIMEEVEKIGIFISYITLMNKIRLAEVFADGKIKKVKASWIKVIDETR
jgi:hypothetical protein